MRTASTAAIVGTVMIYTALASGAAAQEPNFSGNWRLDPRMSQDPYEKVDVALGTRQLQGAGTSQYNSVNRGTLLRDTDRVALRKLVLDYVDVMDRMEIEHANDEMKVWVGANDEFFSLFYLDGREHSRQIENDGGLIKASATWEGESLVVEQRGDSGAVLRETFSPTPDGGLAVLFHLQSKQTESPLMFRVVYEREEEE